MVEQSREGSPVGGKPQKKARKKPRKATPKSLENAAVYYLQRFDTTARQLRRVLMRRVDKSVQFHDTDPEEGAEAVDHIVRKFIESGVVDDFRYATARAASLQRRGNSTRAIRSKLYEKGVSADVVDRVLEQMIEESGDPDLTAAKRLARRRRLGPYRDPSVRPERRDRDLAAMARAGFGYDIAIAIVDAATVEEIEVPGSLWS